MEFHQSPFAAVPALSPASAPFSRALALVAADMREVDATIARRLDSGVPLVGEVARYIISAGGKRLRPVLLLLTCGALGCACLLYTSDAADE